MKDYRYMDGTDRIGIIKALFIILIGFGIITIMLGLKITQLKIRIDRIEQNTADSSSTVRFNLHDREGADTANDPPADPLPLPEVTGVEPEPVTDIVDMHEIELHNATLHYRITCYGPPTFTMDSVTASGLTVGNAIAKAKSLGLDGIVAVSPDTPWYDDAPRADIGIYVSGVSAPGFYLVCDRTARYVRGVVDIYNPNISWEGMWNERGVESYELDRGNQ